MSRGMELWKPTGVSFSAGGGHIVALLGALSRLIESGTTHTVTRWYGCSAGSFCAYVGALGVSPTWIRDVVTYFDTRVIAEVEEDSMADFMNCWGLNSGSDVCIFIGRFLDTWESGASKWTFAQLSRKRPGISLHITATNLTMGSLSIFSKETTPDMRVLDAIRASLSVPLLFTPWKGPQGDIYCDGAIMEYFPWSCIKDKSHTLVIVCSDTGICHRTLVKKSIKSIGEYIDRIFKLVQQNQCSDNPRYWIAINNTSVDEMDFKIEKEERLLLFQDGITAVSRWLEFRKDCVEETRETRPLSGDPNTLVSCHGVLNKRSETLLSHNRPRQQYPFRGLHNGEPHSDRRWSL